MRHLPEYVDKASKWDTTSEGQKWWLTFYTATSGFPEDQQRELLDCLPQIREKYYAGPNFNNHPPYVRVRIIAKYWHRFGNLPSAELFKSLL